MLQTAYDWLFASDGLTAHGFCLLWEPDLIWMYLVGNGVTAVCYFVIPCVLAVFVQRRKDFIFRPVFGLFALFIVFCGLGHVLELATIWVPLYRLEGSVAMLTAAVSLLTAVALWRLLPQALALPSPIQYREVRASLAERESREAELAGANAELARLARHLGIARDRAEAGSRAKSRFLAGMSHELRTPLNGILGYAHLLRTEEPLSPVQAARVDSMLGAGRHLLEMITRVLDMSEIEAGHTPMSAKRIDVVQLATDCLDCVRPIAENKHLAIGISVAPGVRAAVVTDPTRLRQILLNLLGNAVKFTARGAIELRLRAVAPPGGLRIEVIDSGPGVPADRRAQLFEEFERVGEHSARVEGAGLGLAISRRLAASIGATIGHDDNSGGGSIFWLQLPPGEAETAASAAPELPALAAPQPSRALHILVVDDLAMNRDIAGSILRADGHIVTCAGSGAEAVTAATHTDFDAVLMDVRMPGMDGLEATRHIRALPDAGRAHVPIIALTAQAFTTQIEDCMKAGMNGHLPKPFDPATLSTAVERAIAGAVSRQSQIAPPAPVLTLAAAPQEPVIDADTFAQTFGYVTPDALRTYLDSLADRAAGLLRRLSPQADPTADSRTLIDAVHALSGSAGLFGFRRLSTTGRAFEVAMSGEGTDRETAKADFVAALETTLVEIQARMPAVVAA